MKSISSKMVVYNYNPTSKIYTKSNVQFEQSPVYDLPYELQKQYLIKDSFTEDYGLVKRHSHQGEFGKPLTGLQKTKFKNLYVGDMLGKEGRSLLIVYFHDETQMFITKYYGFKIINKPASRKYAEGQFPELYSKIKGSLL